MLLMQVGSWAFSGMNLASSAYLAITCVGLIAVIVSRRIRSARRYGFAVFATSGSLALTALSSFFLINVLSGSAADRPLYVAGLPTNLGLMYALAAFGSAVSAAFTMLRFVVARKERQKALRGLSL
jgi:hypothetical protein